MYVGLVPNFSEGISTDVPQYNFSEKTFRKQRVFEFQETETCVLTVRFPFRQSLVSVVVRTLER